jgi:branched-chain amino acid transport system permease protein
MLYTSYEADQAMVNTTTKKAALLFFLAFLVAIPLFREGSIGGADSPIGSLPGPDFLAQGDWLKLLATVFIFAIGGLGLNILTGLAGQVSLGHAFFMGHTWQRSSACPVEGSGGWGCRYGSGSRWPV